MKKRYGLLAILVYFLFQLFILPYVGMTWDEPSSFFFGRATLRFYLTGDRGYVTESEWKNSERFGNEPFQYIYGEDVYPPFPFVIASLFSLIFSENFHLMSTETAHHLGLLVIGMVGVLAIYGIGKALGWSEGIATGVALLYGTYPTIIGQMRNDAKDVPLMSMIVVFIFMMIQWIKTYKPFYALGAGVSFGLALASKPTAAIMPPILALFLVFSYVFFSSFRRQYIITKLFSGGFFIGTVSILTFFLTWPWLWDDPIGKLHRVWEFFRVVGRGMPTLYFGEIYRAGENLPWHYPLGILIVQTPESMLIIGAASLLLVPLFGILKKNPWPFLFIVWILVGMGRFFLPGVIIYAKVRHFIDVMPAFFLVIGVFLHEFSKLGSNQSKILSKLFSYGSFVIVGTMLLQNIWVSITHAPYEPSYFNSLVGGTKTAAEKRLFDVEYWASAAKEG
ncbi:MAG: glycosyltransferase family 39 protein, partial [Patescibacteria group bacterium]|nr:glycosyltransferase family 39 protein [Patescibacteria group bacterium]